MTEKCCFLKRGVSSQNATVKCFDAIRCAPLKFWRYFNGGKFHFSLFLSAKNVFFFFWFFVPNQQTDRFLVSLEVNFPAQFDFPNSAACLASAERCVHPLFSSLLVCSSCISRFLPSQMSMNHFCLAPDVCVLPDNF